MTKMMGKATTLLITLAFLAACSSTKTNTQTTPPVETKPAPVVKTAEQLAAEAAEAARVADEKVRQERTIYFEFDKSNIRDEYRSVIEAHANYLAKHADVKVKLEGNADERGTPEYNVALGEARAKAVADIFKTFGVSETQMEVISYGEERPVDNGHNEDAWAKNRRVEIVYQ